MAAIFMCLILMAGPHTSSGKNPKQILAWSWHPDLGSGFIMYNDKTPKVDIVGKEVMDQNGHNTYLPDSNWILNDTYPDSRG